MLQTCRPPTSGKHTHTHTMIKKTDDGCQYAQRYSEKSIFQTTSPAASRDFCWSYARRARAFPQNLGDRGNPVASEFIYINACARKPRRSIGGSRKIFWEFVTMRCCDDRSKERKYVYTYRLLTFIAREGYLNVIVALLQPLLSRLKSDKLKA